MAVTSPIFRQVDISDVKDDSSITLDGDLSDQALAGTPIVLNWGDDQASNFVRCDTVPVPSPLTSTAGLLRITTSKS